MEIWIFQGNISEVTKMMHLVDQHNGHDDATLPSLGRGSISGIGETGWFRLKYRY